MKTACDDLVTHLRASGNAENVAGMARYGINPEGTLGVLVAELRRIARDHRGDHALAIDLWETGIHEARILASMVDDPLAVSEAQMDRWVDDLDSWDVCDQVCNNLFRRTVLARDKAREWCTREETFVRRAGFTLIAVLAVHDKTAGDGVFLDDLALIREHADDGRNFVKKAANWALRQIGKRSATLHGPAVALAEDLARSESPAARWIGRGAARELTSEAVRKKLGLLT